MEGLSLNSPPYNQSESHECHRYPSATAGGPDGCGSPVNAGEAISQGLVRSKVKKLLSGQDLTSRTVDYGHGNLLQVLSVCPLSVVACPPILRVRAS